MYVHIYIDVQPSNLMKIYVILSQELSRNALVNFEVTESDLVVSIKKKIEAKEGISAMSKCLKFKKKQLEDNQTLSFYNIKDKSYLILGKKNCMIN